MHFEQLKNCVSFATQFKYTDYSFLLNLAISEKKYCKKPVFLCSKVIIILTHWKIDVFAVSNACAFVCVK